MSPKSVLNPAVITPGSSRHMEMIKWRRHIHAHPELAFMEQQTSALVAKKLQEWGIEITTNWAETGVVGRIKGQGGPGPLIALRADMDALSLEEKNTFEYKSRHKGKMHACGHDGHSAMLLGAAAYLAETRDFNGTVYFIFQPDEEHGKGAQAMIDDGLFERFQIDAVYGLHNLPGLPEGTFTVRPGSLMASESSFEIEINGIGGHAAMPHMGVDPIVVGSQVVLALQTLVSRNLSAIHETAVVSATEFVTNGTVNVIPSQVVIKGDCRCFTEDTLAKLEKRMEEIVAGICSAAGAQYRFEFINTFYPTVNSAAETEHAIRAAQQVLGADNVNGSCDPFTISEDFSSMLRVKPGCYGLLGNGVDSVGGCALHNPNYDFNDRILPLGARYWIQLVQDQLV